MRVPFDGRREYGNNYRLVVHVGDILAAGEKARCDEFGRNLNGTVPVKNLGQLRWYSGSFYERDWEKGTLKISQQTLAEQLADEYGIKSR